MKPSPEVIRRQGMVQSETWGVALGSLRANKIRALLTMLGVIIGSGCIVLVITVALTGRRYILAQIEGIGANLVYAEVVRTGTAPTVTSDEISLGDMQAVRDGVPMAAHVAGTRHIPMTIVVGSREYPINLVGVTEDFQAIRNLFVVRGRYFDPDEMAMRSKVCLLTEPLAQLVSPNDDPVGKSIRVGELTFQVIGVFRERVATFGQTEIREKSLLLPFGLIRYYTGTEFLEWLYAQADKSDDVSQVTMVVKDILETRHRAEAAYRVHNLTNILETARKVSYALTGVLLVIGSIALGISGVGIMNIMLVTVTERTKEIGVRKALGAKRREILQQFLVESFLISGTGAVIGITIALSIPVLAELLISLIPGVGPITIPISWVSVLLAFLVSSFTGIFFGYLPASRAAALHPVESLRYE